jgi:hypothetical protein
MTQRIKSRDATPQALKEHCMLEFDDATMAGVMADFRAAGGGGDLDYNTFCAVRPPVSSRSIAPSRAIFPHI